MAAKSPASLSVTLPSDREIVLSRQFAAPRELVFEAMSQPQHLAHWYDPYGNSLALCEIDLRPGGAWRIVHRDPEGHEFGFRGQVREIVPPECMVRTFEFEGLPGHVSVETLVLTDLGDGRTQMTVTARFDSVEDRDGMLQSGMEDGAAASYDRLALYLEQLATHSV